MARPTGSLNKTTFGAKDNLGAVFMAMGGIMGLTDWASKNPSEFYKMWAQKLIPNAPIETNISANITGRIYHKIKHIELVPLLNDSENSDTQ